MADIADLPSPRHRPIPTFTFCFFLLLLLLLLPASASASAAAAPAASAYIVHVSPSSRPSHFSSDSDWYSSALSSVKRPTFPSPLLHRPLYVYRAALRGFAAFLTKSEAAALASIDGILAVSEDSALCQLHTTRTPEFLGLTAASGPWPESGYGDDVIIGVMDSGIWPEKKSFSDQGMGPIPAKWKGECEANDGFGSSAVSCNRKLIGARSFYKGYEAAVGPMNETMEYKSARDNQGHGTHTASTAAGRRVGNASLLGSAGGVAVGIAPAARIAVYKVCWKGGCFNSDLLAAFDHAILDGVDIISLSIGGGILPYFLDPIAVGGFAAMEHGILVSTSASNAGPSPQSVTNVAPWLLTVAASTLDRDFPASVKLPHRRSPLRGVSLYDGKGLGRKQIPLVYAGDAGLPGSNGSANLCMQGTLDQAMVSGKIVVCDRGISARAAKGMVVKEAGGAGMILANAQINGEELIADSHVLPATLVGYSAGVSIKDYIRRSGRHAPTARLLFSGTVLGVRPAPVMAAFSSRGPNPANPDVLKPDVTAPGVNILAAWTSDAGPTELPGDDRVVDFNIMSGTSMSCPHVSGVAALLKAAHPDWSPAAIKSAIMTTATTVDNTGGALLDGADSNVSTPFAYGAGHVDPEAAMDPGLIYDITPQDYVDFLCGLNYSSGWLSIFTKDRYNCSGGDAAAKSSGGLNYPALSFVFYEEEGGNGSREGYSATITRTVTNVGEAESVYTVVAAAPPGVEMEVKPAKLEFTRRMERRSFNVTCSGGGMKEAAAFGSVEWRPAGTGGRRRSVRSPVVVMWLKTSSSPFF